MPETEVKETDEKIEELKENNEKEEKSRTVKTKRTSSRGKVKKLEEEIKKLRENIVLQKENYLRQAADFDNYKKLMNRETENRIRSSVENIILEMLPVLDDLDRTISAVPEDEQESSILDGVKMIRNNMKKTLEKFGVQEIESVGKEFNVEYHEAMMMLKDENYPSDIVVQEHQKGYKFQDRVIRHAKVAVNKLDS